MGEKRSKQNFNPRSREVSDFSPKPLTSYLFLISIHAPARGATADFSKSLKEAVFQSTLPRGERRKGRVIRWKALLFQSTLPRGERHTRSISSKPFNRISIHAPARGATWGYNFCKVSSVNFNPRSREGSDFVDLDANLAVGNFNPRSREGSDYKCNI